MNSTVPRLLTRLSRLIPASCYIVDEALDIVAAEDLSLSRLGIDIHRLVGCRFHPLATPDGVCSLGDLQSQFEQGVRSTDSLLCLNCVHGTRTYIYSWSPIRLLTDEAAKLFLLVGHDVTTLVEDADRNRYRSLHDPLTGAYNRWFLDELLQQEEARSRRSRTPIAIKYVDIDNFKSINDTYGHAVGDRVLQHLAESLRNLIRECDAVVRVGGDEFLLILPGADEFARSIDWRLRQAARKCRSDSQQPLPPFTISLGSSYWHPDLKTPLHSAINHADIAMYRTRLRR